MAKTYITGPGPLAVMVGGERLPLPPGWSGGQPQFRRIRLLDVPREPAANFILAVRDAGGYCRFGPMDGQEDRIDVFACAHEEALRTAAGEAERICPDLAGLGLSIGRSLVNSDTIQKAWPVRGHALYLAGRSLVMGIINVTPDSFSDGGRHERPESAAEAARRMVEEGADLLDVGGESTRPGAKRISVEEEIRRVCPAIEAINACVDLPLSIDTSRAVVAREAIERGASVINDVSAGADPEMFPLAAEKQAGLVLMHMKGTPETMQADPQYSDLLREVYLFLHGRVRAAMAAGILPERIVVDPGLGFGKSSDHNLALIARLGEFLSLGVPILSGPSRKGFLGRILKLPVEDRVEGTIAACVASVIAGASVVRVHDVRPVVRAVRVTEAIVRGAN